VPDDSTLDDVRTTDDNRGRVGGRRVALGVLLVIVLVASTGWLGVHSETARASGDGYRMSLTYPRVARSGLDIPWKLTLRHAGGFTGDITVAITADYFDIFEFQGMHPEPSDETATERFVYLTFAPPPAGAEVFTVALDTYVQPASQIGRDAVTAVIIGGHKVAQVSYKTWLVP
jgi:hypothetical protein